MQELEQRKEQLPSRSLVRYARGDGAASPAPSAFAITLSCNTRDVENAHARPDLQTLPFRRTGDRFTRVYHRVPALFRFQALGAGRRQVRRSGLRGLFGIHRAGLGIVFILFVILASGYLSSVWVGRKLIPLVDWVLTRFPIINTIYPPARQFSRLVFATDERKRFNRVVLVPYPSSKSFAIGFRDQRAHAWVECARSRELLGVLVPFGPTPFTGVLLYFAPTDVVDLDLPVDAAIKTIVPRGLLRRISRCPLRNTTQSGKWYQRGIRTISPASALMSTSKRARKSSPSSPS